MIREKGRMGERNGKGRRKRGELKGKGEKK